MSHELTWLLVAVPALSAAILLLGGKATNTWGHLLGTLAPVISFAFGVVLFFQMRGNSGEERSETVRLFEWFSVGHIKVDFTLLIDPLPARILTGLLLILTGILLSLPIPFTNYVFGGMLIAFAFALVERDGVLLALVWGTTVTIVIASATFSHALAGFLRGLF